MRASELRLGNLIYVKCIAKECGYDEFEAQECNIYNIKGILEGNEDFLYKPIRLTEEWLLKFGFNKDYKKGWIGVDIKSDSGGMTTDFVLAEPLNMGQWQTYYAFVYNDYRFTGLEFVHQLQNLYFALTQKELTLIK